MKKLSQQQSLRALIIYMITALLFMTSVEIHIHDREAAATSGHGFAVDISSLSDSLKADPDSDEIVVSPDSVLNLKQSTISLLAVFMLVAIFVTVLCRSFIGRRREDRILLSELPYFGAPPLRAPPLYNFKS